jgi:hypothetical protein
MFARTGLVFGVDAEGAKQAPASQEPQGKILVMLVFTLVRDILSH